MRLSGRLGWLLISGTAMAWPGIRQRQAQPASDICTCPSSGPSTTTVLQYTIITSSVTLTTGGITEFSTGMATTEVVTVINTSTLTVITGTTTSALPGVTETTTDTIMTTSTITDVTTLTTCIAGATRKVKRQPTDSMSTSISTGTHNVKRQNSNSASISNTVSPPAAASATDPRPILTYTSTISSRVVTCVCTPRPQTTTLASISSCQCPETTAIVTVSSISTGVVFVTEVSQSPTTMVLTPTVLSTTTLVSFVESSDLATVATTDSSLTLISSSYSTVFTTFTSTIITCLDTTTLPSTSTTQTTSSTSSSTRTAITATGSAFVCNATSYFISTVNNIPSLYNINLQSAQTSLFARDVGAGAYTNINGMGYNPLDNYLYAVATRSSGNYVVIRFTTTGFVREVLRFTGSTTTPITVGDFDTNGQFWFSGAGTSWYHVDLAPGSSTYGTIINSGTSTLNGYYVYDWAYLPGQGDYMYSLARTTDSAPHLTLLRWSLTAHTWSVFQDYPSTSAATYFFAVWGGSNATLWGLATESGRITRLPLGGSPVALGVGETGLVNGDGARCVLAPA